jgi:hypothetical protein
MVWHAADVLALLARKCYADVMNEPTITCPNCRHEIKLTESLAAPLIEAIRREFEQRLAQQEVQVSQREAALRQQQAALAKARQEIDEQVAAKLRTERAAIAAAEGKRAREAVADEIAKAEQEKAAVEELLKQRDVKLAEAQKSQVEMLKKQRELDDARRELELTVERRVQESLAAVRESARKQAEDDLKLKVTEKELQIASMQRQIEELRRKAEQGSQQQQGEALELELESLLRTKFPRDTIEPVAKGEYGGDVLQRVCGPAGQTCGSILWESKRTKYWSDGWLAKLRGDQRAAKAELAIIVSQALPKEVESFDLIEDVWVVSPRALVPLAVALRNHLIAVACERQTGQGQQTKMEMIYQYLTGSRFRQRVQAILEKYTEMRRDLDKERSTMNRLWAKREEQIRCVIESTAGMYGDLQGIAGQTLPEIEGLAGGEEDPAPAPVKRLPERETRRVDASEATQF